MPFAAAPGLVVKQGTIGPPEPMSPGPSFLCCGVTFGSWISCVNDWTFGAHVIVVARINEWHMLCDSLKKLFVILVNRLFRFLAKSLLRR